MLVTFAGWIAPAATMIAAMMTAANLGARVTGWGFVVFTVGAVAWIVTALATGQQNLLVANGFLLVVNVIGVWRWLGQRAVYAEGAQAATEESAQKDSANLFAIASLEGRPLLAPDGATIGTVVDAMATSKQGRIAYVVVREGGLGGVGERLHAIDWRTLTVDDAGLHTQLDAAALAARTALQADHWPTLAELGR
jgi:hypothetical protein